MTRHRTWVLHFTERESFAVVCVPEATRAEVLARWPQAVAAEPHVEATERPQEALTVAEQASIRKWLHGIGESDPETVAAVVRRCQESAGYRRYFLARVSQEHTGAPHADRQSVSTDPEPAPPRRSTRTVAKSYTRTYTGGAEHGR